RAGWSGRRVICASGAALALGATDPVVENADAEVDDGVFVRRQLGPHLVREAVIVRLQEPGSEATSAWADAYRCEPTWLDQDLGALGLPPLAEYWTPSQMNPALGRDLTSYPAPTTVPAL
ncbi:MAG: hypothetical protein L6311_15135, partial [Cellulomonas sp.]|nr:hypothetical protein [Cellulomonas sp.]